MSLIAAVLIASGLGFDAPAEWVSKPSSSSMRVAVWELTGDDAPAEVVIFYFGEGSGGGVEANLARWFGQFEQPDGSSTRDRATITERTVNGLELTVALVHNSDRGRELAWPRLPSSDHLAIRHPERRHGVQNLAPDPCLDSLCRQPSRSHR